MDCKQFFCFFIGLLLGICGCIGVYYLHNPPNSACDESQNLKQHQCVEMSRCSSVNYPIDYKKSEDSNESCKCDNAGFICCDSSNIITTCKLTNSTEGQCVAFSSCPSVNKDFTNPDSHDEFQKRRENCKSAGENFICCEREKISEYVEQTTIGFDSQSSKEHISLEDHPNYKLFNMTACGRAPANSRIANGIDAGLFEFRWSVRLRYLNKTSNRLKYQCGGTLISDYYVLTAAHCIEPSNDVELKSVRLGEHNVKTDKDCIDDNNCADPVQDIEVESFIGHPGYDNKQFINDIGLVRLKEPAKLTQNNIRTICLPFHEFATRLTEEYTVAGWGATTNTSSYPILQKAYLPHYDNDKCQEKFVKYHMRTIIITDDQLCAGGEGKVDACRGDSGMALQALAMVKNIPQMVQYGIVSYGVKFCGQLENFPGVYTKVSGYLNWILDNMR